MTIHLEHTTPENEYIEILNGIRKIKKKHNYTKVRIMLNDDGSGEIQAYDKNQSVGFSKIKLFQNFDELLSIFQEYFLVK